MTEAFNIDCMEYMKTLPDKAFDLAVVDPPYGNGGGEFSSRNGTRFGGRFDRYDKDKKLRKKSNWDYAPGEDYFKELFRVSKNQIIWGGNYFSLPPCRCFIIWKKTNIPENFSMAMCEYAWCSFNDNAKIIELSSQDITNRFHPTQKPVALYEWIYSRYAKEGDKILDTHMGSGSSRIAAYNMGFDYVGCEINKDYCEKEEERFKEHSAQLNLFLGG